LYTFTAKLKTHFDQFGEVMDVVVKRDPNNNRSRGFGFILFKEDNCVEKVNVFFNEYCRRYCGKKSGC